MPRQPIALLGLAGAMLVAAIPCADAAELRSLWSKPNGQIVPLTAAPGKSEVRTFADTVVLIHEGADERVVYTWELPGAEAGGPPFGRIHCQVISPGDDRPAASIPVAQNAVLEWDGVLGQSRSQWEAAEAGKYKMLRQFQVDQGVAALRVTGQLVGKSLVLEVTCDKPLVARSTAGEWGVPEYRFVAKPKPAELSEDEKKKAAAAAAAAGVKPPEPPRIAPPEKRPVPAAAGKWMHRIAVPFLDEDVHAFPAEKIFATSLSDWRVSNEATNGDYPKLTDGKRNLLVARFVYTASKDVREVLPNIPHAPAPFREDMGKRLWFQVDQDNPFDKAYTYLERLTKRGMRDYALVLPVWQFKGPEAALPQHFPAKGNPEELKQLELLGKTCAKLGIRFALQEEYSDMWPDYEKFSERFLCVGENGMPADGYKDRRGDVQAKLIKPALMLKFAEDQGKEIHRAYETSAAYLGRHASNPRGRGIDYAAGEGGAGTARHSYEATCRLLAQARALHSGPVLAKGGAHWRYAGFLDAASAEAGAGWKAREGQKMPLFVDFDLQRIHPLQVSCGMGEMASWLQAPDPVTGLVPWGGGTPMWVLDQYRMQQVIFGHGSMLSGHVHDDEGLHWLESHLVLPVARAYAAANAVEISYKVGGAWVDASAALWADDMTVVRVRYENGLEIIANGSEAVVEAEGSGVALPQFGWVARQGESLLAYTGLKDGLTVDYARSEGGIFVNARLLEDWVDMRHFDGYREKRGTEAGWQAKALNSGALPVDFGGIRTNGSVRLRKEGQEWVLTAFPREGTFEVLLKGDAFRAPFEVVSEGGAARSVKPESVEGGAWWKLPLNGAIDYRFPAAR